MSVPRIVGVSRLACLMVMQLMGTNLYGNDRPETEKIVQYGEMHAAIGQGKHGGRVRLGELTKRANFYGVAALAGLAGEATIQDGKITATMVGEGGRLKSAVRPKDQEATLLVGAYVSEWTEVKVNKRVAADDFDAFVGKMAKRAGVSTDEPFVFTVEGKLENVRMHVINGACPIRARMKNRQLSKEQQPYEKEMPKVDGTVIGVFAKDAVGKLTPPATTTHVHILYRDTKTGEPLTGHLEAVGLQKGAVLKFPKR